MSDSKDPACVKAREAIRAIPRKSPLIEGPKPFFPWDRLLKYFKENNGQHLRDVLECPCDRCARDAQLFGDITKSIEYVDQIIGVPDTRPDWDRTSISLLALLTNIGRPQFITPFLHKKRNDNHLEVFTGPNAVKTLQEEYWPEYTRDQAEGSAALAEDFVEWLPRFAIPRLDSPQYVAWGADRVLPFIKQEEIGSQSESGHIRPEGGHSRVFVFEIYHEYRKFRDPGVTGVTKFARKQITVRGDLPPLLICLEKKALSRVTTLSHPHIIKLVKVYKLGEDYNLVFPRAKTNLDKYLRNPDFEADNWRQGPLEQSPLWNQLYGITEAVGAIHSFGEEAKARNASEKEELIGFHFDIKDANILVMDDGTWVITDFGQAIFKDVERDGTTTRVLNNQGGTDSYAPPELNDSKEKLGRSYDIFSLGCIYLEVLAFIVRGHEGLTKPSESRGLDAVRRTPAQPPRREDHRFYTKDHDSGTWKIKGEIEAFMRSLAEHIDPPGSPRTRQFLAQVISLIRRMLSPAASDRPEAQEVCSLLKSHLEEATFDPDQRPAYQKFSLPAGKIEIEKSAFAEMSESGLHRRDGQSDEKVHLHVLREEGESYGTIEMLNINKDLREPHTLYPRAALIPFFSFPEKPAYNGPAVSFVQGTPVKQETGLVFIKIQGLDYYFTGGNLVEQAQKMQSIMTGQRLSRKFAIDDVELTPIQDNALKKVFKSTVGVLSGQKNDPTPHLPSLNGKKANAQLWKEYESSDGAIPRAKKPIPKERRERAKQADKEAPPCRVVLYCGHSILLLRIVQNEKIKKLPPECKSNALDVKRLVLEFTPTDKSKDESFMALILHPPTVKPDTENGYAAIPLGRDWLQELEENKGSAELNCTAQEFSSIKLKFRSLEDKEAFRNEYNHVKDDWRARRHGNVR
ncbi:MAG: hypothetical protein Q9157_002688 [Trypethelium eluteriae]